MYMGCNRRRTHIDAADIITSRNLIGYTWLEKVTSIE
jgi:hypothetical protein